MDLGLARAGFKHAWFCESDRFCRDILGLRWPGVPIYNDVRDVDEQAARVDLIAGGFPCPPVSLVGRRQGRSDDRWLWPEFLRVIRVLRPRFVLVENVPGLLTLGMGDVLGGLAESGYDAEWDCIPAAAVGAPHIRDRVFVLAYPSRTRRRENTGSAFGDEGQDARWGTEDDHVANGDGQGDREGHVAYADGQPLVWASVARPESDPWPPEPGVGRMAHGVPHRVDRLRALGNGVVPQVAEWIGRRIIQAGAEDPAKQQIGVSSSDAKP